MDRARHVRHGAPALHLGWEATHRLLQVEEQTSAWHQEAMPGRHWYLWTVAVDPTRQGEGIGGVLMRHTFARADADHLPCYLETTHPKALAIHRRNGFAVVKEARIADELTVWAMVRPAA
ncbi:MAG: GNAT family N-acetyltransferase [Myxococcales bacterium]|nr:GNAT family N-acetyltransferase [Myxococcales bacterium]